MSCRRVGGIIYERVEMHRYDCHHPGGLGVLKVCRLTLLCFGRCSGAACSRAADCTDEKGLRTGVPLSNIWGANIATAFRLTDAD